MYACNQGWLTMVKLWGSPIVIMVILIIIKHWFGTIYKYDNLTNFLLLSSKLGGQHPLKLGGVKSPLL